MLDEDLFVKLFESVEFFGCGLLFLVKLEDWVNVFCFSCGILVKWEIDIMDIFIDLFWYYLCYLDVINEE